MRLGRLALASVLLLGWTGGATASPLIPTLAGISLQSHSDIEAARWRHRNRGYSWGDRGDGDCYAIDGSARSFNSENRSTNPKLSCPTSVVATIGVVFGAGGATQIAMGQVTLLLVLMVQTVSPLLK